MVRVNYKPCSVVDCTNKVLARGLCGKHYYRWRKYGDPLVLSTKERRFWAKVDKNGPVHPVHGRCWNWTGSRTKRGYGRIGFNGKGGEAHRLSWIVHHGSVPNDLYVLHKCDNPLCVNPDHLFLGTHQDNVADCIAKGRQMKGERQHCSVLTKEAVKEIRRRYVRKSRMNNATILAREFGISRRSILDVIKRVTWKHVD